MNHKKVVCSPLLYAMVVAVHRKFVWAELLIGLKNDAMWCQQLIHLLLNIPVLEVDETELAWTDLK